MLHVYSKSPRGDADDLCGVANFHKLKPLITIIITPLNQTEMRKKILKEVDWMMIDRPKATEV